MEDSKVDNIEPYKFKLTNTCNVGVNYNIDLEIIQEENAMSATNIATKIDEESKVVLKEDIKTTVEGETGDIYKIGSGTLEPHTSVEHSLRLWLDINAGNDAQNKTFKSKIIIDATQNQVAVYTEQILHGADPVISEDLVPVKINPETGTVTKANMEEEWYSYERREWANAVILTENGKNKNYQNNQTIEEDDIESYFVWIPKYRYKLWNLENYASTGIDTSQVHAIDIEFGLVNTTDDESIENHKECATPNKSGADGQCAVGDWMTHPAFIAFDTNGFWVGKFETSDAGGNKVQIKPNVYSWKNITVKNMFDTSYAYQRDLDSHMMKNTEWGAVAYLSHSKYGTCNNNQCTEIRLNNNSGFVTGYAAKTEPATGYNAYNSYENKLPTQDGNNTINYTNPASQVASTTNNYTGVYDMSGGVWEYVMGVIKGSNDTSFTFGSSGFSTTTFPFKTGEEKSQYYDVYDYNTSEVTYNRRILGDATGEMGPFGQKTYSSQTRKLTSWYDDDALFAYSTLPWFTRGGSNYYGTSSGAFAFIRGAGGAVADIGFRIVLAPKDNVS